MKNFIFLFCAILICDVTSASSKDSSDFHSPRIFIGMQFGGQALYTWHFEYRLFERNNFTINGDVGFGRAEYADDVDFSQKATRVVHLASILSYGKRLRIVATVHPSFYFQRHYSFININGLFGVRYLPDWKENWSFMISYTPRVYYSPRTDDYIFSDMWISVRVGWWFE